MTSAGHQQRSLNCGLRAKGVNLGCFSRKIRPKMASQKAWLTRALASGRRARTAVSLGCHFSEVAGGREGLEIAMGVTAGPPQGLPGISGHT